MLALTAIWLAMSETEMVSSMWMVRFATAGEVGSLSPPRCPFFRLTRMGRPSRSNCALGGEDPSRLRS